MGKESLEVGVRINFQIANGPCNIKKVVCTLCARICVANDPNLVMGLGKQSLRMCAQT